MTRATPKKTKTDAFTALNGLRFLAALAVVCFHYGTKTDGYNQVPETIKKIFNEGPAAVGFFFILSGFVLGYRYLRYGAYSENSTAFYWARFTRLYPAYLLGFLLFAPLAVQKYLVHPSMSAGGQGTFISSAILSLLTLQAWTPLAQAWNGPSWSLSVESFMYVMFPLIGFRLIKLDKPSTLFVACSAWLVPTGLACGHVVKVIPDYAWEKFMVNSPILWLPLFIIGICSTRLLPFWEMMSPRKTNFISTFCFLGVILLGFVWPRGLIEIFIVGGIAPILAVLVVSFTRTSGWITAILGGAIFNKLGQASYIIYIIQSPLWHYWQALTNFIRRVPLQTQGAAKWQFFAFVPFVILVSLAVQRFIEEPVRSWLNKERLLRASRAALTNSVRTTYASASHSD
jgi:peptidoglycan/LPS O-acetylase OafA/YrhL